MVFRTEDTDELVAGGETALAAREVERQRCPAPRVFQMIGGKWKLAILQVLIFRGTRRFGELRREIEGVTQTMLTQQLRALERDGLVRREVFAEVPPRVEYSATEDAVALTPMFESMHAWWLQWRDGSGVAAMGSTAAAPASE